MSDIIETIERFSLDIIGTVIPGFALLFGVNYFTGNIILSSMTCVTPQIEHSWVIVVVFSYILGHAITSFGFQVLLKPYNYLGDKYKNIKFFNFILTDKTVYEKMSKDKAFIALKNEILKTAPSLGGENNYRTWRNIAMGIVQDQSSIIYRYTFISIFNLGMSCVALIISFIGLVNCIIKGMTLYNTFDYYAYVGIYCLFISSILFIERYYRFNDITLKIPISMALAKLQLSYSNKISSAHDFAMAHAPNKPISVYLAGGFQSGWQDTIKKEIPDLNYLDPRSHGLEDKKSYTSWDLEAIHKSDCVFAYLESTNPGGYALALEIGYAKAKNKHIIFINEKPKTNPETSRYYDMIVETSNSYCETFEEGIKHLKKFKKLYGEN